MNIRVNPPWMPTSEKDSLKEKIFDKVESSRQCKGCGSFVITTRCEYCGGATV